MPNPLYNKFGGNRQPNNILSQLIQVQKNPAAILDILLQNGKINQQQYNDMKPFGNNPEQIVNYLVQHGNSNQINQATQMANQINTQ